MANRSHRSLRAMKPSFKHKCVMLGESGVGKSNIVQRFAYDLYTESLESTIGVAYHTKKLVTKEGVILFELWDTAGQERYRALSPMYFRSANSAVVVYDITSLHSFHQAKSFVKEVLEYFQNRDEALKHGGTLEPGLSPADLASQPPFLVLVGNKIDREEDRQVLAKDAIAYAAEVGAEFLETSCLLGTHVQTIFQVVAQKASHSPLKGSGDDVRLLERDQRERQGGEAGDSSGCCS